LQAPHSACTSGTEEAQLQVEQLWGLCVGNLFCPPSGALKTVSELRADKSVKSRQNARHHILEDITAHSLRYKNLESTSNSNQLEKLAQREGWSRAINKQQWAMMSLHSRELTPRRTANAEYATSKVTIRILASWHRLKTKRGHTRGSTGLRTGAAFAACMNKAHQIINIEYRHRRRPSRLPASGKENSSPP
jgi:hypothetical protein